MATTQDDVDDLQSLHQAIVARLEIFPYDDVLSALARQTGKGNYHVFARHRKFFPEKAIYELDGYILLPHYSFSIEQNFLVRHTATADLAERLEAIQSEHWESIKLENIVVFYENLEQKAHFSRVARLLAAHFHTTLYDDILRNAARRYRHLFSGILASDEEPTMESLFAFLETQFGVNVAFFRSTGAPSLRKVFSSGITEEEEIRNYSEATARYSVEAKRKSLGVLTSHGRKVYCLTVPLRGVISKQSEVLGAIFLANTRRISPLCEYFLNDAISEVFLRRQIISRSKLVTQLASEIARYDAKRCSEWSVARRTAEFRKFARTIVRGLNGATSAHSCTLRLFDQNSNSLSLVAADEDLGAGYDTSMRKVDMPGGRREIRVEAPFRSLNAFCFSTVRPGSHIYLRNVSEIGEDLRRSGLAAIFRSRSRTVSEFVVPLYWGGLRIGTMNLEADFETAFELDDTFIGTMAFLASSAWATLQGGADRYWLSQISFTHLATHELADFRRSLERRHQTRLDKIVETLSATEYRKASARSTLFEVILFGMAQAKALDPGCDPKDIITVTPAASRKIVLDAPFSASLKVIFESIIKNAHRHSHIAQDRIAIDIVDLPGRQKKEISIVYQSRSSPADPDDARYFFYKPLSDSEGLHFGMFLIGAHVRLLGGHISIHKDCLKDISYGPLQFSIRIPFEGARNAKS